MKKKLSFKKIYFVITLSILLLNFSLCLGQIFTSKEKTEPKKESLNLFFKQNLAPETALNISDYFLNLQTTNTNISWFEVGPTDVGGRIRAIAIDRTNSNTLLVGGVTGGIWKTTNGGTTWVLKSDLKENFNVTSIIQSPSNSKVWYASTGEVPDYFGSGVLYKTEDNGETWTNVAPPQSPKNYLYLTARLAISPTSNTIFVATNGFGIARSTDGGATFSLVLGNPNGSFKFNIWEDSFIYSDVIVNKNGVLLAQVSGDLSKGAGFYKSTNDGVTWTNITPSYFTALNDTNTRDLERSVLAFAPSNPNIAYAFTNSMVGANGKNENIHFHKINVSAGTFEDRSFNLVKLNGGGQIYRIPSCQNNYDMAIAVKPDDENFVVISGQAGTFRSANGYATDAGTYNDYNAIKDSQNEVGGLYKSHLDHHIAVFDPNNPKRLWSGNDGGINVDHDATGDNKVGIWESKNNGLNITQFYDMAIAPLNQGNKVIGAAQDNSGAAMKWDKSNPVASFTKPVIGGDGLLVSWQNNYILGMGVGGSSPSVFNINKFQGTTFSDITFPEVSDFLPSSYSRSFLSQYSVVNPNNEDVIYFSSGIKELYKGTNAKSWVSKTASEIKSSITTIDISVLGNSLSGFHLAEMAYGNDSSDTFYFSVGKDYRDNTNTKPRLFKLRNASTASLTNATEISSPLFPGDCYIEDIVLNRKDNNEFMLVFSNPNTSSVLHTTDGGLTYKNITANLALAGFSPQFNCAEIITTTKGDKFYLIGTSQGLFSASSLNGDQTIWSNEAMQKIGKCIVTDIDFRSEDNMIGVSTFGRGIFMADATNYTLSINDFENNPDNAVSVYPNPISSATQDSFTITFLNDNYKKASILLYDITGKKIKTINQDKINDTGEIKVNTSDLSKGVYLLKLYDSSSYKIKRVFKLVKN